MSTTAPTHDSADVPPRPVGTWTLLTNHGHALVLIARDEHIRLRELAEQIGITDRAVQGIVNDLVEGGYVLRARHGRRNRYVIVDGLPMRHPVERACTVTDLLDAMR